MSNWTYVVVSYALTWAVIIGYTVVTATRIGRAHRRLIASGVAS